MRKFETPEGELSPDDPRVQKLVEKLSDNLVILRRAKGVTLPGYHEVGARNKAIKIVMEQEDDILSISHESTDESTKFEIKWAER